MGTSLEDELSRYRAVIHLRVPGAEHGYHTDPIRTESASRAAEIDRRIAAVWAEHPNAVELAAEADFAAKTGRALEIVRGLLPPCRHQHTLASPHPVEEDT